MTYSLSALCYIAFLILAVMSPFLPIFLVWRVAGLAILSLILGKLIEGPIHWSDKEFGYAIGIAMLFLFVASVTVMLVIRLAISGAKKKITRVALAGPNDGTRKFVDMSLMMSMGCIAGVLLTNMLANVLSGVGIGRNLDLSIAALASVIVIALLLFYRKQGVAFSVAMLATLAISAGIGSMQMNRIMLQAKKITDGRAWCFTTAGGQPEPISSVQQLGFFSLPKRGGYPHLGILVSDDNQAQLLMHWSIRQQEFAYATGNGEYLPSCYPIKNFAEALVKGRVKSGVYAIGPKLYAVPKEYHPDIYIDRLVVYSDMLTRFDGGSKTTSRIELNYSPREPYVLDDVVPLNMIPKPDEIDVEKLKWENSLVAAGIDKTTGNEVVIRCLSGAYADLSCSVNVINDSLAYDFYLPAQKMDKWREAVSKVEALFRTFEVSDTL